MTTKQGDWVQLNIGPRTFRGRNAKLTLNPCQTEGHRYNDQSICVVCGCGMRDVTPPDRDAT